MRIFWLDSPGKRWLWCLLVLLSLDGCSTTYHFQYHYSMISPPGGTEGVEDDQVRIQLTPDPATGVMQLTIANKSSQPMAIVWKQTYYIDPLGHRTSVTETGTHWFFRLREWSADDTLIAPGETLRTRAQPGEGHQTYDHITISRTAEGTVTTSTAPRPLLPGNGKTPAVGKRYRNQEFHFVLALRTGVNVTQYPFTFRITEVDVR
jgi:hypothetical protein